jgi:antitoxin (DNA-binding transcriptional repressor) of toxin-antitoxin stability system
VIDDETDLVERELTGLGAAISRPGDIVRHGPPRGEQTASVDAQATVADEADRGALANVALGSYIHDMDSAGIRDLKNNLSRYLRTIRPGDVIAITDRGRIIAELRSPSRARSSWTSAIGGYERLIASRRSVGARIACCSA